MPPFRAGTGEDSSGLLRPLLTRRPRALTQNVRRTRRNYPGTPRQHVLLAIQKQTHGGSAADGVVAERRAGL